MASARLPGPTCHYRSVFDVDDGTLCRMPSPGQRPVGVSPDDVANWSPRRKLLEAARRTTSLLPAETRDAFASLFTGRNLAITAGVLTAWGASHAIGIGEIADVLLMAAGLATMGTQALQAARDIASFVEIGVAAKSAKDLDTAADHLARAVVAVGVTAFVGLILKYGSRFVGGAAAGVEDTFWGKNLDGWLATLGKAKAPPLQRENLTTALRFFQERFPGKSAEQIEGYLKGMDLSKAVARAPLPAGTEVVAYGDPTRLGMYYTKVGSPMDRLGIAEGSRRFMRFRVKRTMTVLESKTTGVADTWTTGGRELVGGGGTQYIIPDAAASLEPVAAR